MKTPWVWLPERTLRAPAAVPPTVTPEAFSIATPAPMLGTGAGLGSKLPVIVLPWTRPEVTPVISTPLP